MRAAQSSERFNWVQRDRVDAGEVPGTTSADAARLAELEKENRELRRANTILVERSSRSTLLVHLPRLEGWGESRT